jgi:hypothetical protein
MSHETKESEGVDTLIFTIGRMNPPTTGHMGLVRKMIEKAIELEEKGNKTQVAIVLSHSHEKDMMKNPLRCKEDKRELVKEMVEHLKERMNSDNVNVKNVNPIVLCMDDEKVPNMYSSIGALVRKYTPKHMILCVGKDRDENYSGITKYYSNVEINIVDRPEGAMSATEMRGYVTSENKDMFVEKMLDTGLSKERIEELYEKLHKVLTAQPQSQAPKSRKRKVAQQEGGKRKTIKRHNKLKQSYKRDNKRKTNKHKQIQTKNKRKSLHRRR